MVGVWVVCSKVDIWWSSNFLKNHRFLPKTRSDLTGGTAASVSGPIPKVVVDQSGAADGNMLNPDIRSLVNEATGNSKQSMNLNDASTGPGANIGSRLSSSKA